MTDPKRDAVLSKVNEHLRGRPMPEIVQPHEVLVALWEGDDKIGSIIIPDKVKDEQIYQGKTGLVLAMGAHAFEEDEDHRWPKKPVVGDWVMFRVGDGFPFVIGNTKDGKHCRLVHESKIRMVVDSPDLVY